MTTAPPLARLRPVAAVAAGGLLGSLARYAIGLGLPRAAGHWPWAALGINCVGAFALCALLGRLRRLGPDDGRRRLLRLALGTGFLGAFTTYSGFVVDALDLLSERGPAAAAAYCAVALVLGTLCGAAGLALGGRPG